MVTLKPNNRVRKVLIPNRKNFWYRNVVSGKYLAIHRKQAYLLGSFTERASAIYAYNFACCLPNRSGLYFWLCKSMGSQQQFVFEFYCKLYQCTVSSKKYLCTVIYKCISGWVLWCPIPMLITLNSSHRNIFASFILKLNQPCLLLLAL